VTAAFERLAPTFDPVLAELLRLEERNVGALESHSAAERGLDRREPGAHRQVDRPPAGAQPVVTRAVDEALDDLTRGPVGAVGEEQRELVARESGEEVVLVQLAAKDGGELP